MRNIGERIRALRTEKGITLPRLADDSGLSKGLLSKLENSETTNPSLDTLYKIVEALDVTLADVLETEHAQVRRIVPDVRPVWQNDLVSYLKSQGKEPDQDILNAMYMLRNRKGSKTKSLEHWKFLYLSIENSFKK
jgi:transcriptional regulator with XRE-family HTH domain